MWFQRVMDWFSGWLQFGKFAKAQDALATAATMIDHLIPVIEAIDNEVKPIVKDETTSPVTRYNAVFNFIVKHLGEKIPNEDWVRLTGLPTAELLANVAMMIARKYSPDVGDSILRLAIELAYTIYKATKK